MMTPTYQSPCGQLTLYREDNMKVLPAMDAGSVDAVITDPPYGTTEDGVEKLMGMHASGWRSFGHEWDAELPTEWIEKYARRVMREGAAFIAWTDDKRLSTVWDAAIAGGLHPLRCLFWNKTDAPTNPRKNFTSSVEAAVFGRAPGKVLCWHGGGATPNIIRCPKVYAAIKEHPTQKPERVMEWCIAPVTDPGHVVLDPFMGSGTTGAVALKMGRSFIGIERDPVYYAAAEARLVALIQQGRLFG